MSTVSNPRHLVTAKSLIAAPPLPRRAGQQTAVEQQSKAIVDKLFAKIDYRRKAVEWEITASICFGIIIFTILASCSGFNGTYPWHESVVDNSANFSPMPGIGAGILADAARMFPTYRREFSMGKFLASFPGWIVIVGGIACVVLSIISVQARSRSRC